MDPNFSTKLQIQSIQIPGFKNHVNMDMLRLDQVHPIYGGNKYFKLKYHIKHILDNKIDKVISFGGPFSNHLHALSAICYEIGIKSFGIVRGYDHYASNPTMKFCIRHNMNLIFLKPKEYDSETFLSDLLRELGSDSKSHIIPMGGTDELGVQGASEILDQRTKFYSKVAVAVGSAGTISGIIRASNPNQEILGFSSLKAAYSLDKTIEAYTNNYPKNWKLIHDYHFGGFAKQNPDLKAFAKQFYKLNKVMIDPIYQVKMLLGIKDLLKKEYFSITDRILIIHCGGLQAHDGFQYLEGLKKRKQKK